MVFPGERELLDDRQTGLTPGGEPSGQIEDLLMSGLAQDPKGTTASRAGGTADQHRLASRKITDPLVELRQRDVTRVGQMPGRELGRFAHVKHDRIRIVDQTGCRQRVERRSAAAALQDRPQQHGSGHEGDDDQDNVFGDEIHGQASGWLTGDYRIRAEILIEQP